MYGVLWVTVTQSTLRAQISDIHREWKHSWSHLWRESCFESQLHKMWTLQLYKIVIVFVVQTSFSATVLSTLADFATAGETWFQHQLLNEPSFYRSHQRCWFVGYLSRMVSQCLNSYLGTRTNSVARNLLWSTTTELESAVKPHNRVGICCGISQHPLQDPTRIFAR